MTFEGVETAQKNDLIRHGRSVVEFLPAEGAPGLGEKTQTGGVKNHQGGEFSGNVFGSPEGLRVKFR